MASKSLIFVYIFTLIINKSLSAEDSNCECGISDIDTNRRIVGGREAAPHSYPWIAAISYYDEINCGGTLIDNMHIVTAAHCIPDERWKKFIIYLNLHDWYDKDDAVTRTVTKAEKFIKNDASFGVLKNDVAILTLDRPVTFTEQVLPICLPKPNEDFSGNMVTVAGWGVTSPNGEEADKLQEAQINLITHEECKKIDIISTIINDNMICAYAKGKDGCQGDSGGPLMEEVLPGKWQLVGIVSWGVGCANPEYPGIYTAVSKYVKWIGEVTKNGTKCTDLKYDELFED